MTAEAAPEARRLASPFFGLLTLPAGMAQGFITVTLGFILTHHGFSVAEVAGLVSLHILPSTWKFLLGPMVDMSLSPKRWYMIGLAGVAACLLTLAFTPLAPSSLALLSGLALVSGVCASGAGAALIAIIALTVPVGTRGRVAGWMQTGNLGGMGLGGGAGLWVASHAGGPAVAAAAMAALCLLCGAPILRVSTRPAARGRGVMAQALGLWEALWEIARTRSGVMAIMAVTVPAALGAAANLLPSVAADWRASANLVALVTGVLGGLASVPGCIIGGYLCDRLSPRTVYMCAALACAAGEAAMALAPHTELLFAVGVLGNALILGVAWGSVSAVIYECLGPVAAATVGSVLGSLCNLPVVVVTMLVGVVQTHQGSTAMLLVEAGLGAVSVAAFALVAWLWRPVGAGSSVLAGAA